MALKGGFKALTGSDWKPTTSPVVPAAKPADQLNYKIAALVDKDKKEIIRLKSEFKLRTGADMKPATAGLESKEPSWLIFTFFLIGHTKNVCNTGIQLKQSWYQSIWRFCLSFLFCGIPFLFKTNLVAFK